MLPPPVSGMRGGSRRGRRRGRSAAPQAAPQFCYLGFDFFELLLIANQRCFQCRTIELHSHKSDYKFWKPMKLAAYEIDVTFRT